VQVAEQPALAVLTAALEAQAVVAEAFSALAVFCPGQAMARLAVARRNVAERRTVFRMRMDEYLPVVGGHGGPRNHLGGIDAGASRAVYAESQAKM